MTDLSESRIPVLLHIVVILLFGIALYAVYGYQKNMIFWLGLLLSASCAGILLVCRIKNMRLKTIANILYAILMFVIVFACNLHIQNTSSYGKFISESMGAIFQSNVNEMLAYLFKFGSVKVVYISTVFLVFIYATYFLILRQQQKKLQTSILTVFVIIGICGSYIFPGDIKMLISEAHAYSEILNKFSESRNELDKRLSKVNMYSGYKGNMILVIGESTTRHHMSIYNYFRNTTPRLDRMKDDLVIYSDVISTHSHTTESLSDALILNTRHKRKTIYESFDLINVLKRAGFNTVWLSNQNATGVWDNVVSVISKESNDVLFHSSSFGKQFFRDVYDHEMLDTLKNKISETEGKQFVVFHSMAGHFPYCGLIPEEYRGGAEQYDIDVDEAVYGSAFGGRDDTHKKKKMINGYRYSVDCYDDAMRYVDYLVSEIFSVASNISEPTLVVYIADHGEAPLLGSGHESRQHSHFHVEIPFIIYANDAYKNLYPDKYLEIVNNRNISGSLIDLPYTLLGMLDVKGIGNAEDRDMTSRSYLRHNRTTLHNKVYYDTYADNSDSVERARGVLARFDDDERKKIWSHRINSLGSLIQSKDLFEGVEMDIVFDGDLKVYHPPAADVGLKFSDMLKMDNGVRKYWLDIKNLGVNNSKKVLARLSELDSKHELKGRSLLETDNIRASGGLSANGWKVSYYLPTDAGISALSSEKEKRSYASKVQDDIETHNIDAISFDLRLMPIYEQYLKEFCDNNHIEIYVWAHWLRIDVAKNYADIHSMVKRDDIEAMLVRLPSPFYR